MNNNHRLVRDAWNLALLYLPLLFLSPLIETLYPFDTHIHYNVAFLLLPFLSALLCCLLLISENAKTALKKWGLSLPFTLIIWICLSATNFSVRLTNTLYPGYGRGSVT